MTDFTNILSTQDYRQKCESIRFQTIEVSKQTQGNEADKDSTRVTQLNLLLNPFSAI